MREGDEVRWNGVNKVERGTLLRKINDEEWYVWLQNRKAVVVNESSFIK